MDWSKPATLLRDPPRRLALGGDPAWHDADDESLNRHGSTNPFLLPPTAGPSVKTEGSIMDSLSMATHGLEQLSPPMTDFMTMHQDPGRDFLLGAGYPSSNESLAFRGAQAMATVSSYLQPLPPIQTPSDYFGSEGAAVFLVGMEDDAAGLTATSVMQETLPSESDVEPEFSPTLSQLPGPTPSMLDLRSDDLEEIPPDNLLTPQQLNQMLVTPPSTASFARPAVVSPVNQLPPRSFSRTGQDLCCAILAPQTPYFRTDMDDLEVSAEIKFSPDRRKLCCIEGCKSQARAYNRCKRHGGSKRCASEGCTKSVQSRGLCIRHGGGSRCQEPGCSRAAQSHGRCKMHGGGRPCMVEGCEKKAHLKRLCRKHGGGSKCRAPGCDKWSQRQGLCMTHSKETKQPLTSPSNSASSIGVESPKQLLEGAAEMKPEKPATPTESGVEEDIEV